MPLRLDIRKKLCSRSDRVKAIDLHPTEPWICASLYNGNVHVWNIESQQLIKTFEVCQVPVRAVRFVARMNWIVTGADNQCVCQCILILDLSMLQNIVYWASVFVIIAYCVQLQHLGACSSAS